MTFGRSYQDISKSNTVFLVQIISFSGSLPLKEIIWTKNTGQLFLMTNLFMKFQNCNLIFCNGHTNGRKDGQAQSNMPLQLFQSMGHKKGFQ